MLSEQEGKNAAKNGKIGSRRPTSEAFQGKGVLPAEVLNALERITFKISFVLLTLSVSNLHAASA